MQLGKLNATLPGTDEATAPASNSTLPVVETPPTVNSTLPFVEPSVNTTLPVVDPVVEPALPVNATLPGLEGNLTQAAAAEAEPSTTVALPSNLE